MLGPASATAVVAVITVLTIDGAVPESVTCAGIGLGAAWQMGSRRPVGVGRRRSITLCAVAKSGSNTVSRRATSRSTSVAGCACTLSTGALVAGTGSAPVAGGCTVGSG